MSEFKQLLDQVTSNGGGSKPNCGAVMEIVENVKTKTVSSKKASVELLKKLLNTSTETVAVNLLIVVDSIVKNTPSSLHKDFLTWELLTKIKSIITKQKTKMPRAVDKALEMIREWHAAFGDDSAYKYVHSIYSALECSGFIIPEVHRASASYMQKPPLDKLNTKTTDPDRQHDPLPAEHQRMFGQSPTPAPSAAAIDTTQEQDDLQLAIAMSLNEQENKKPSPRSSPVPSSRPRPTATPAETKPSAPSIYATLNTELSTLAPSTSASATVPTVVVSSNGGHTTDKQDSELDHYLNRAYWERKAGRTAGGGASVNTSNTPDSQQQESTLAPSTSASATVPTVVVSSNGGHTTDKQDSEVAAPLKLDHYLNRAYWERKAGRTAGGGASVNTSNTPDSQQQESTLAPSTSASATVPTVVVSSNGGHTTDKQDSEVATPLKLDHYLNRAYWERKAGRTAGGGASVNTSNTPDSQQQETKLALLYQQKAEQMAYGQSMQQERLGRLTTQRVEYERNLAAQREQQRQLLIQQKQVFQQQFGADQPYSSIVEYAPPLPYQLLLTNSLYQPSSIDPMASYQPTHPATINNPVTMLPPQSYAPPPQQLPPQQQPHYIPQSTILIPQQQQFDKAQQDEGNNSKEITYFDTVHSPPTKHVANIASLHVFEPQQHQQLPVSSSCTHSSTDKSLLVMYTIDDDSPQFVKRVACRKLTLRDFKEKVFARNGSYRFFFKSDCDGLEIMEEITEEADYLPIYNGKIVANAVKIEPSVCFV